MLKRIVSRPKCGIDSILPRLTAVDIIHGVKWLYVRSIFNQAVGGGTSSVNIPPVPPVGIHQPPRRDRLGRIRSSRLVGTAQRTRRKGMRALAGGTREGRQLRKRQNHLRRKSHSRRQVKLYRVLKREDLCDVHKIAQ